MATPSLGEMLRVQSACEKAHCLVELEQKAAKTSLCAEHDLELVKDFFHQAMAQFTSCILARIEVRPMVLGNGANLKVASIIQTYRWKTGKDIRDPGHPYHAVWTPFETWCDENDLRPEIEVRIDRTRREQWYALTVSPMSAHAGQSAPPTGISADQGASP